MKSIYSAKLNARVRLNDILVKTRKSATFRDTSHATLGPKIWNSLPQNIKAENSYVKFKEYIFIIIIFIIIIIIIIIIIAIL